MANNLILNEEQKKAVEYNQGPLLVIAGAGTGKTAIIVEKIKHLLKNNLAKPEEILTLTFTEKAAYEMETRVDEALPYGIYNLRIATFHAFAEGALKEKGGEIGLPLNFKLLTDAESILFFRKNLFLFDFQYYRPLGNPNKFLEVLLKHFSRLKDEDIDEETYINFSEKNQFTTTEEREKYQELARAYELYQKIKIKEGYLDFADLVFYLLKLFRQRPNVLKEYQKQYRYLLVDEFQDTNFSQYQLIKLLSPPKKNPYLTVVGDDNQSIYKFRGASISNILSFMKDYPQAQSVTLIKNFRSHQAILDAAYQLIKKNDPYTLEATLKINKRLISQRKDPKGNIQFYLAQNINEETEYVLKKIKELVKNDYQYSDIAILIRANNHAEPFINSFIRNNIPYQLVGPGILFKQPEIKDLIAYLKILYDLEDSVSLYRVLSMNIFNFDTKDLSLLLSFAKKINRSLFQAIEIYLSFFYLQLKKEEFNIYKPYLPLFKKESKETLWQIFQMILKHIKQAKSKPSTTIIFYFLQDTGYLKRLTSPKNEKEEKVVLNIAKFFEKVKEFENHSEDNSVRALVEFLELTLEVGESPLISRDDLNQINAVNILTVHAAKGLEFPVIFLVNLVVNRFPSRKQNEVIKIPDQLIKEILPSGDYHLQEERRLFYVGLTRAKDLVFLTSSKLYGGEKRLAKLSPFVIETLGEEKLNQLLTQEKEKKAQLSIFDFQPQEEIITENKTIQNFVSYSQINVFQTCPLQYRYQYILKIPIQPSAAASFGSTIHIALQKFYSVYKDDGNKFNEEDLIKFYYENWIPIGYHSFSHEKKMKKEGEKMLRNFFKKFHHQKINICALEKSFKLKLDGKITLTGKIDRIDKNNNQIEIIDYKTGSVPKENQLKKDLQLAIYTLAVAYNPSFKVKLNDISVTYYYLQKGEKFTQKKSADEIEKAKEKIIKIVKQINQNEFPPNVGPWCDFCPFRMICEAWQ